MGKNFELGAANLGQYGSIYSSAAASIIPPQGLVVVAINFLDANTPTVLLVFIDAGVIAFEVKASWVDLLQLVLITVIGAYFGGRTLEKKIKK